MNRKEGPRPLLKNSVARLIICQAMTMFYDDNNEEKNIFSILEIINNFYIENNFSSKTNKYHNLYKSTFVISTTEYIIKNKELLDEKIKQFLTKEEPLETLDLMILQILRTACAELELHKDLDKKIIINEYVDIAAEFFDSAYITFINGILDNIAFNKHPIKEDKNQNKLDEMNTNINKYKDKKKQRKILTISNNIETKINNNG